MTRRSRIALFVALSLAPALGLAEDLLQVYRDARAYDAQYASAKFALEAGREKLVQGDAQYRP
ncbi:MAG: channel protein TolC, partial [Betaproteobacteria bacterium]|nr:channel protein TolC [Betaproteobacteria bacterium]